MSAVPRGPKLLLLCAALFVAVPDDLSARETEELPAGVASWKEVDLLLDDVRHAAKTMDAHAWGRLIQFPLVWRDGCRTVKLRGEADLRRYLPHMMTPNLRRELLRPGREALELGSFAPLGLAGGRLYLQAGSNGRLRIAYEWSSRFLDEGREAGEHCHLMSCHTRTRWHSVDAVRDQITYRSGRLGRNKADKVLYRGWEGREGSTGCAHAYWVFRDKTRRIVLVEQGCGPTGSYSTAPLVPAADERDPVQHFSPGGTACRVVRP